MSQGSSGFSTWRTFYAPDRGCRTTRCRWCGSRLELGDLIRSRLRGGRIYYLTDFYEHFLFKLPVLNLRDGWLILAHGFELLHHTTQLRAKRVTPAPGEARDYWLGAGVVPLWRLSRGRAGEAAVRPLLHQELFGDAGPRDFG